MSDDTGDPDKDVRAHGGGGGTWPNVSTGPDLRRHVLFDSAIPFKNFPNTYLPICKDERLLNDYLLIKKNELIHE